MGPHQIAAVGRRVEDIDRLLQRRRANAGSASLSAYVGSLDVSTDGLLRSYCQWEAFNATCFGDDVIIVTSAHYGRMRIGRCLAVRYAIGCSADVTDDVDRRCSGRRACTINLPDVELVSLQPCRKDLVTFMEAAYKCVTRKSPSIFTTQSDHWQHFSHGNMFMI